MKEKKINKNFYGMIAAALVAVLAVLCGGLLMQSPTTSANAAIKPGDAWVLVDSGECQKAITVVGLSSPASYTLSWRYEKQPNGTTGIDGMTGYRYRLKVEFPSTVTTDGLTKLTCSDSQFTQISALLWHYSFSTSDPAGLVESLSFTAESAWAMVPLPEPPPKDGHTFIGWFTDEACTIPYTGEMVRDDVTLYAGYEINRYTVTYNSAGGSACDSVVVDWNTAPESLPTPTRIGYNFVGWFDGETQYTDGAITGDKTLVAHWEIKTFTVTFMVDGKPYKTMTVEYGTSLVDASDAAELKYFNLFDEQGERQGRTAVVTENITLNAAEMTQAEKVGYFLGRNSWILITAGVIMGLMAITIAVTIIIIKRG